MGRAKGNTHQRLNARRATLDPRPAAMIAIVIVTTEL